MTLLKVFFYNTKEKLGYVWKYVSANLHQKRYVVNYQRNFYIEYILRMLQS